MDIYQSIGLTFVVFTSALGTFSLGYFVWFGITAYRRQRARGEKEEEIANQREIELRAMERGTR